MKTYSYSSPSSSSARCLPQPQPHSLPPQPPSGGTLITVYTANPDKTYSGIILSGSYEAGHIHTYNVTLGNVHVDIRPADNDLPWNDGDIRPDLPPNGYDLTVSTAQELKAFAEAVNYARKISNTSSVEARFARVLQTADINLAEIDDWTPIGNDASPSYNYFQGIYNGNGYTISNLKIRSGETNKGLFGYVTRKDSSTPAVLTGIHLRNVDIDVSHNSNIFCGAIAGEASSSTVITFCSARGEIKTDATSTASYENYSGGIIGNNNGTISYCRADVKVIASSNSSESTSQCAAGGIVGYNYGTILACEASGSEVSAQSNAAEAQAGGIAGCTNGYITSCTSGVGKLLPMVTDWK